MKTINIILCFLLSLSVISTLYTASAQEAEPTPYDTSFSYDDSGGRPPLPEAWASPAGGAQRCDCVCPKGLEFQCLPTPPRTCAEECVVQEPTYCNHDTTTSYPMPSPY